MLPQLFKQAFSQHPEDTWTTYKCCDGSLPDLDTVDQYQALYLSGGHYSAYEKLPWIQQLCSWIHDFVGQERTPKLLGICFGCQVDPP